MKLSKQINIIGKCYLIRKYEHVEKKFIKNKTVYNQDDVQTID